LMRDSVYGEEKIKIIEEIQTKYETEKKEKENEILKKDAKIKSNIQLMLIISVTAFIFLSILLFFLFRIKNKSLIKNKKILEQERKLNDLESKNKEIEKERLKELVFAEQQINNLQKEKIEHRNRELSTLTLHILNKNQILSEITGGLQTVKGFDKQEQKTISNIQNIIDGNKVLDQDWEQFKMHFDGVHKGFFEKLENNYPDLTQNDIKLCAYIRIKLNTKEIARMLNVTIAAINKSRQRLKKRLELDIKQDLGEFISQV